MFVLMIITMSFAILTCVVIMTALLTRWITDINRAVKQSKTNAAKATARLNKFRKSRIKHILKLRKLQRKEDKENKKYTKKHGKAENNGAGTMGESYDELDNIMPPDAFL
jgi:ABC-type protease/lipase transport system fused ATPase/permease subunit